MCSVQLMHCVISQSLTPPPQPVGALNPKRAALFSERFDTWEDEQVPRFHYGTHYSTCSFTLMWLLRLVSLPPSLPLLSIMSLLFTPLRFSHPEH